MMGRLSRKQYKVEKQGSTIDTRVITGISLIDQKLYQNRSGHEDHKGASSSLTLAAMPDAFCLCDMHRGIR